MTRHCRECGSPLTSARAEFCAVACRRAWNNRRAMRGAELYDLFRALRRDRREATERGLWKDICRLEEKWQIEDQRDRPGRRSYAPMAEAVQRLVDSGRISRRMTPSEVKEDADRRRLLNRLSQPSVPSSSA